MKDFPAQGTITTDIEDGSWQDAVKIISNLRKPLYVINL